MIYLIVLPPQPVDKSMATPLHNYWMHIIYLVIAAVTLIENDGCIEMTMYLDKIHLNMVLLHFHANYIV